MARTALAFIGEPRGFTNKGAITNNNVLRDYIDTSVMGKVDIVWLMRDHFVDIEYQPTKTFVDRNGFLRGCETTVDKEVLQTNLQWYVSDQIHKVDKVIDRMVSYNTEWTAKFGHYYAYCMDVLRDYDEIILTRSDQFLICRRDPGIQPLDYEQPGIEFLFNDFRPTGRDKYGNLVLAWMTGDLIRFNRKMVEFFEMLIRPDNDMVNEIFYPMATRIAQAIYPKSTVRMSNYFRTIRVPGERYYPNE